MTVSEWIGSRPMGLRHWQVYMLCSVGMMLDAVDIQVMGLLAPVVAEKWGLGTGFSAYVFSLTAVGMLLGSLVAGSFGDRVGRKPVLIWALLIFSTATIACAYVDNAPQLLGARFVAGIGLGAFISSVIVYLIEFLPSRIRGLLMGIWTLSLPLGNLTAAGLTSVIGEDAWRTVFLVCGMMGIPLIIGFMLLPESPVFLARMGKEAKAIKAVRWLTGSATPTLVEDKPSARIPLRALFEARRARITMLLWTIWFCWNVAYFGVVLWLPTIIAVAEMTLSPFLAIVVLASSGITGRVVAALALNVIGRRSTVLGAASGAMCAATVLALAGNETVWLFAIGAMGFFLDGGASALVTWTPELHPTKMRASGVGFANAMGRLGAIVSPLAIGALIVLGPQTPFWLIFAILLAAFAATIYIRVETKGRDLDAVDL